MAEIGIAGRNTENSGNAIPTNFIREIINGDLKSGKYHGRVAARFPPEPNGYLHIGHAKSICINFGIAKDYSGTCNLRMDDTNPAKEDIEYVESIMEDIKWLGFEWSGNVYYASDYYEKLYEYAEELIKNGKAYVCDLSADEIREYRGTLTKPGKESPNRNRTMEENLDLFRRMRAGEFADGSRTLRAKIDMTSPNLNLRDPVLYRILRSTHHRTGDRWCIYPMYDYAHPLSDYFERITHSICTLEFEDHRPLYNWVLEALLSRELPQQIEFARLNLNYTVMSKRKLLELVENNQVDGWDDPRMPTLSGLRRRGYTPDSIRKFADMIGVSKSNSTVDIGMLEFCIREDLNKNAPRVMAVLRPLKVIIDNYPDNQVEELDAENNPENPSAGTRKVTFSKVIYIENDDFMENPSKKYFRLSPGSEVRLKYAYYITCTGAVKDEKTGVVKELHCTYDPQSRGGGTPDGRVIKGTLHWVSAAHAVKAEVRLYDHLFTVPNPGEAGADYRTQLNPNSMEILRDCLLEPSPADAKPGSRFQFMRQGYFCVDTKAAKENKLVFNRTVTLKDTWAKISNTQNK